MSSFAIFSSIFAMCALPIVYSYACLVLYYKFDDLCRKDLEAFLAAIAGLRLVKVIEGLKATVSLTW